MDFKRDGDLLHYFWPVKTGGTAMNKGALVMPGVTAETDLGVLILATSAAADAIGILNQAYPTTVADTLVAGTVWTTRECEPIVPMRTLEVPYDQADTAAVASTSTTTVTITSLEDNIDTSYLYAVAGTGAGSLYFLATSASGSCVTKTATGWDNTTTVIKILRLFHPLAKLNATSDKIGSDAAAGSWTCLVVNNFMRVYGGKQYLDPTKHNAWAGPAGAAAFFADVCVRNSAPYTID